MRTRKKTILAGQPVTSTALRICYWCSFVAMLTHGRRRKKINVCRWQESKPSFNLLLSVFVVSGSYVQRARAVDFLDRLIFWGQKKITGLFFLPRSNHYFYACSEYQKKDECPKKRSVSWTELFSGASNFLSLSLAAVCTRRWWT